MKINKKRNGKVNPKIGKAYSVDFKKKNSPTKTVASWLKKYGNLGVSKFSKSEIYTKSTLPYLAMWSPKATID